MFWARPVYSGMLATLRIPSQLRLQFSASLASFSRESQFLSADQALPSLSRLRQLAALNGNASALGSLHLVVARLEACRGHCINARRHVELVRTLSAQIDRPVFKALVELVDSGLEMYGGNLGRAINSARLGVQGSAASDLVVPLAGSLTNLGSLNLFTGRTDRARKLLGQALEMCEGLAFTRLSALDSLAQVALQEDALGECSALIEQCRACIGGPHPPRALLVRPRAPAHSLRLLRTARGLGPRSSTSPTRPTPNSRGGSTRPSAPRCSAPRPARSPGSAAPRRRGRARHRRAHLSARRRRPAHRPRSLQGPLRQPARRRDRAARVHFDRALAACRAIGHRYHESWIDRERADVHRAPPRVASPSRARQLDVDRHRAAPRATSPTILGAGHSIDLLAHRMAAILRSTHARRARRRATTSRAASTAGAQRRLGHRRRRHLHASACAAPTGASPSASRGVQTIDEISLLKSVADLVQAAVNRTADTETEDEDQNLWPRTVRARRRRHDLPLAAHGRAAEDRRCGSPPTDLPDPDHAAKPARARKSSRG